LTVPEELAGLRLDQALAQMFPEYSRSRLKEWLLAGAIRVEGGPKRPRDPVSGGETVEIEPISEPEVSVTAEPIRLDIVFEDDDLLVVNKPAGLVVHPGAGNPAGTLMNGLLHHEARLENVPRAGIIHRIDKDTSGLLLVAKTLPAHTALVRQLAERAISREYLAICCGVLTGGGMIDQPLARHPVDRKRMSVQPDGRPAVTHFTVLERFRAHTYVRVRLETGGAARISPTGAARHTACSRAPRDATEPRVRSAAPRRFPGSPRGASGRRGVNTLIVPDWPAPAAVIAGTTTRATADDGLPIGIQFLSQVHGATVVTAETVRTASQPVEADAVTGRGAGAVCAVRTADCLPVLYCARDGSEIAAAHAGWRGLAAGVLENTVTAMASSPEALLAWIGPGISQPNFEVGDEVRQAFISADPGAASAFVPNARGRWQADLVALARRRLAAAGVRAIYGGEWCTYADSERFFSYRRDPGCGRLVSFILLK
jgi:23S rRNA pseudouridine1911/1915/1917 synthase